MWNDLSNARMEKLEAIPCLIASQEDGFCQRSKKKSQRLKEDAQDQYE
jgi:hypothetical protein